MTTHRPRQQVKSGPYGRCPGVAHAVTLLKDEIHRDLALPGVQRPGEPTPDRLVAV